MNQIKSNKIRNEVIWEKVGVTFVADKTRKRNWDGLSMYKEGALGEVIRHDMENLYIIEDMTLHKEEWRSYIRVEK